jgi:hypothetical protein
MGISEDGGYWEVRRKLTCIVKHCDRNVGRQAFNLPWLLCSAIV